MKSKYTRLIVGFVLSINVMIITYFGLLMYAPVKALEVHGQDKILNVGKTVKSGEILFYQVDYCKYTNAPVELDRALVSDSKVTYVLPPTTSNFPSGCNVAVNRTTIVPSGIPAGQYHLELTAHYQVNPLRDVTVRHQSEDFTIVKGESKE